MNDRPTPETDAFAVKLKTVCGNKEWVPVDLSRRLERERNDAENEMRKWIGFAQGAAIQRDEAWESLRNIAAADWKTSGELRCMAREALKIK